MKIKMLLTVGAVGLAAIALNFSASGALLSPRAAGNETVHVAGVNNDPNLVALGLSSTEYAAPRLAENKAVKVAGTGGEVNPSTLCTRYMTASPKAIQPCAENPSGPMACCAVAAK